MNTENDYKFKFSLICAVYNVEEYVAETLDSFIKQDIGFEENVQVILVDDGSKDNSGAICDDYASKYPNNIVVVHKENGGVSTARNVGLKLVEGKYYNFCDPDDLLTPNTLSSVWNFFEAHEEEIDVATIPMEFFEAYGGVPYHNSKFDRGTRVIDLEKEPYAPLFSSSSSFLHHRVIGLFNFDTRLRFSEDAKYINKILMEKCKLGVVANCKYMYRRRIMNTSAINSSQSDDRWYFDTPKFFFLEVLSYAKEKFNGVPPKFLQHTMLCDMKWRILQKAEDNKYLNRDMDTFEEYMSIITDIIKEISVDVVMSNPFYDDMLKLHVLKNIQKLPLAVIDDRGIEYYAYRNRRLFDISKLCAVELCFFEPKKNNTQADLYLSIVNLPEMKNYKFILDVNGKSLPLKKLAKEDDFVLLNTRSHTKTYFKVTIEIGKEPVYFSVKFKEPRSNRIMTLQTKLFGRFFPLNTVKSSYFSFGKYVLKEAASNIFVIKKASFPRKIYFEAKYEKDLLKVKNPKGIKIVLYRWYYFLRKAFPLKKQWLIMDRINKADDNAEAFFAHIKENKVSGVKSHFAIAKGKDFDRLNKKYGKVVEYNTPKFYAKYIISDALISSHVDDFILRPMGWKQVYYKDLTCKKKIIFLQHGVTQNDISGYLNKFSKNITGVTTTSGIENQIFKGQKFCYRNKNIWLTGFSRFDRLYNKSEKIITVMPTWRSYLASGMDGKTGVWNLVGDFEESNFYRFYNSLLNDKRLIDVAREQGYKIQFMPHPVFAPHIERFDKGNDIVSFLDINKSYREIYAESSLVVTDYSSAVFDFAYLRKPVVYAQFDREELSKRGNTYSLNTDFYDKNAFGEICFDYESTIDTLISYIKNDCKIKPKYKKRMDSFFAFDDKNNCERIIEKLRELKLCK